MGEDGDLGHGAAGGAATGAAEARPRSRFWLFLVGLGLVLSTIGGHGLRLGLATVSWPRVEAEIVSSDVTVRADRSSSGTPTIGVVAGGPRSEFAAYAVSFRYVVDGREHIGHGVERGDLGLQNSEKSRDLGHAHPVGSRAVVVVDPADPNDAYLVAGPSSAAKMVTGIGVGFVVIGLWVRAASRRAERRRAAR